jgi:hypothetical protein
MHDISCFINKEKIDERCCVVVAHYFSIKANLYTKYKVQTPQPLCFDNFVLTTRSWLLANLKLASFAPSIYFFQASRLSKTFYFDVFSVTNVNGSWGLWSDYSSCSSTCGGGTWTRTRSCNNPPRSGTGAPCPGVAMQSTNCTGNPPCPIGKMNLIIMIMNLLYVILTKEVFRMLSFLL